MRSTLFLLLSLSIVKLGCFAQDLHFTQTAQTPLLINPAATGVFDGWERVIINHRNQWLGASTQFMTTNIAADANFGKSTSENKAHLGLGLLFNNDVGGDSKFGGQTGALTLSGILPFGNSGHLLSAGIQTGFGNRSMNLSNVRFLSQWNGSQFDPTILSGEQNNSNSLYYFDASGGLYYVFNSAKASFKRNYDFKIQAGLAAFHINNPRLKYMTVDGDRLQRKYVAHLGVVADISNTNWSIDGNIVQVIQGAQMLSIASAMLRYRFQEGTKITGFSQDAYVGFGAYYRLKDAVAPAISLEWKGFKFYLSYDFTVSQLRKAYSGGTLEFSLAYANLHHALFKRRRNY